ncbi:uncharacterized protein YGR127W [Kluyveromyces marxianus DMKU3-1042]|uniref:Uncharacterized protein YGR127W n=1 Tax=Kluyveromyces marxianus (strain DMKU3-1042 / BCC 29191 / NBRC 104275) TaxID=1003335 RepID=W0T6D3_KLUMD|nr:uncharacterized protein KLMA_20507 [Kluyveromyces marxianus DMKU3-1042]BAO38965.1 uncharacterized protein YGR127W [Kluyveromyces marxianus DMKU3-1042]
MCILFATTGHPDYKLIVISNRDEFFERKTHSTCWNHDNFILSPYDLAVEREKHGYGTWLGINKRGKIAVILNSKLNQSQEHAKETARKRLRSRGIVPIKFLEKEEDGTSFEDWDSWDKFNSHHNYLEHTGPFTLFYGDIKSEKFNVIDYLKHSTNPFNDNKHMVVSNDIFYCSEGLHNARWNKTKQGYELLDKLVRSTHGISRESLVEKCFELASNSHYNDEANIDEITMSNVYVPPLKVVENPDAICTSIPIGKYYGTRSQIVILVDKENNVTFEEHVLFESDSDQVHYSANKPKEIIKFQFKIEE